MNAYRKLMTNPPDTDFIMGYFNPSVVPSSGSQSLNVEKVRMLAPLTKNRQLLMPACLIQVAGKL